MTLVDQRRASQGAALIRAQGQATARVRASLLAALLRLWRSLAAYRETDAARFAGRVTPLVAAAQYQVAVLTGAYLSRRYAQLTGTPAQPVRLAPDLFTDAALRNADPLIVYQRPFHQIWNDLADGKPLAQAVRSAERRLADTAATDVQLAKTHAARQVMEPQDEVVGYRRVLKGAHSCGLCVIAATQRYHKADLLPIHGGCDCGIDVLVGAAEVPQTIEPRMLDEIHARIAATKGEADLSARDYRSYLVTHDHGELGAVLGIRGQNFRGPGDLPNS